MGGSLKVLITKNLRFWDSIIGQTCPTRNIWDLKKDIISGVYYRVLGSGGDEGGLNLYY